MTDAEIMRDEYLRMAATIAAQVHKAYDGSIRMAHGHPERLSKIQRAMQADYERNTRHIVRAIGALPSVSPVRFVAASELS